MTATPATSSVTPGATYRFTVRSTEEAVQTIREQLGENARVLSVRQVSGGGLFGKPKLEVVAQAAAPEEAAGTDLSAKGQDTAEGDRPRGEGTGQIGKGQTPAAGAGIRFSDEPAIPRFVDDSVAALGTSARNRAEAGGVSGTAQRLPELLRRSGFSEGIVGRLSTSPVFQGLDAKPLHVALSETGRFLRKEVEKRPHRPLPARTAFLGTAGVGRTTALCKWLALDVFTRQKAARVVKAEFDRPNPAEGLAVFCEALGVPVEYFSPDIPRGETDLSGPIYADLPGLSLKRPSDNKAIADFLEQERITGRVLVLNAAYDAAALRRAYAAGRDLGATHLVFTHLDEVEYWGKLWDLLLDGELQPLFLAVGPSLTGDCDEAVLDALMRKTLPGT